MTNQLPPTYVCTACAHPRWALVGLRQMTPEQRRCTECGGRLTTNKEGTLA